ncbi:PQQ-dependent sugar dehydrogenase [Timonella senegalensis]|uniref:PQQ-dependent sugar dehydrogenase n=1 Tax=Timonella senegalensis TaxID=1465825 RepID=UPI0002F59927|nr:PQQ-dependent sugar dehydrogenase [Timonella senegalensis]
MNTRLTPALATVAFSVVALLGACGTDTPVPTPTASTPRSSTPPENSPSSTSSTPPESAETPDLSEVLGSPEVVARDLKAPWSIVFVGETLLMSERDTGRILQLGVEGDFASIATIKGVQHGGEGGLLGLAYHEGYGLYVYSTTANGNRVELYPLTQADGAITLGSPSTIVENLPFAGFHNGGRLAIGPDEHLYVSVGDAGNPEHAQDPASLGGKILRFSLDGSIPAQGPAPDGNPLEGSPVWSRGHRNVQGLAWAADGTMYASEFGQNTWDELNVIEPGKNYGWPVIEGIGGEEWYVDPIAQWGTDEASPSGIAVLDFAAGPVVAMANLRGQSLRLVDGGDPEAQTLAIDDLGRIRDAVLAPDGALWIITNNTDGRGSPRSGDDKLLRITVQGQ